LRFLYVLLPPPPISPLFPYTTLFRSDKPLTLDAGVELAPFQIAYQTYGTLNAARSNAVLICHALTGDQHVANVHPVTGKPGWWETMVGPGRPIDTERYFVICPNVVGACMGTSGPSSINPATGEPWGLNFPVITIRDMVRARARTSPICRTRRCTENSAGDYRTAPTPPSRSTRTSRSRTICAIRASRSSSASTPTAICI